MCGGFDSFQLPPPGITQDFRREPQTGHLKYLSDDRISIVFRRVFGNVLFERIVRFVGADLVRKDLQVRLALLLLQALLTEIVTGQRGILAAFAAHDALVVDLRKVSS